MQVVESNITDTKPFGFFLELVRYEVLVVDAMDSVETFDTFILLSGDSDFVGLIQSLDAKNKVVKVVSSSKKNQLQN